MDYWTRAFTQAWDLIVSGQLNGIVWVTLKVAAIPTVIAAAIGLPIATALGVGRFRGRGALLAVANAGLGLPPVIIGLLFVLLSLPASGPLGTLHILFTLRGVYIVQTVLALPVIVALSASAVRALPTGLLDQARAFGAGRVAVALLALREARVGILAALIAAVGSALSEVGAVVLAGGNIDGLDQTLASAALQRVEAAQFVDALAIGIVLLGLILVVSAVLTAVQHGGVRRERWKEPA
ncbi:ABC transporter permease [Jatrophihabitans sp. YIM 134969]